MTLAKQIMGSSLIDKSSFASMSSKVLFNHSFHQKNQLLVKPVLVPLQHRRINVQRAAVRGPVAAISEDLIRANSNKDTVPEKAVTFKVRAAVTVRNKNKEDLKETIAKHWDAFADKIGRNVVLELISTEVDPSKPLISISGCENLGILNVNASILSCFRFPYFWVLHCSAFYGWF